jgi:hypothetical protein
MSSFDLLSCHRSSPALCVDSLHRPLCDTRAYHESGMVQKLYCENKCLEKKPSYCILESKFFGVLYHVSDS